MEELLSQAEELLSPLVKPPSEKLLSERTPSKSPLIEIPSSLFEGKPCVPKVDSVPYSTLFHVILICRAPKET